MFTEKSILTSPLRRLSPQETQVFSRNSLHSILQNSTKWTPNSHVQVCAETLPSFPIILLKKILKVISCANRNQVSYLNFPLPVAFTKYQIRNFFISFIWALCSWILRETAFHWYTVGLVHTTGSNCNNSDQLISKKIYYLKPQLRRKWYIWMNDTINK